MAAAEDDVLKKLRRAVATGVSTMNLASQLGSPAAQDAVEEIRMGHEIIKGPGHAAPGAALRRLVK